MADTNPQHYWFIYNPNSLTAPTKQYRTPEIAQMVADKMAKAHSPEKFYVLEVNFVSEHAYENGHFIVRTY